MDHIGTSSLFTQVVKFWIFQKWRIHVFLLTQQFSLSDSVKIEILSIGPHWYHFALLVGGQDLFESMLMSLVKTNICSILTKLFTKEVHFEYDIAIIPDFGERKRRH